MAKAGEADATGVLLDELLLEIFTRLPDVLDLVRCAGTCTRWFRLICCREFLRRIGLSTTAENARQHKSFLIGSLWKGEHLMIASEPMARISVRPPAVDAPLTLTSFIIPNKAGLLNYAQPLVSRRGLLLVRTLPTPLSLGKLHLAVCQPLTGETRLIPPSPVDVFPSSLDYVNGYALLTAADHTIRGDPQQLAFQVLFTAVHSVNGLTHAYCYSSATGSWRSAPIRCSWNFGLTMSGPRTGVVTGGIVHWLYKDWANFYTIGVCADSAQVSFTKIPIQARRQKPPLPCIVGGKLSLVNQLDNGVLQLWTKQQEQSDDHIRHDSDGEWMVSELMSEEEAKGVQILYFEESRGDIIVTQQNRHAALFALDLDNKKVEPAMMERGNRFYKQFGAERNSTNHVFYMMDWPSYIHQLCSLQQGEAELMHAGF